ncbi:MAG: glycosyltransferase family 2 protein [Planctomycetota bacterium]|nr:glycosyltransferase family 2 protein [Planctomycetota bacterium]
MQLPDGVSVIVPVYNSSGTLDPLSDRIYQVLSPLGEPFELLLVEDGSMDSSWEIVEKITAQKEWVRGIRLMRNYGQHNALLCGIRQAQFDKIVTMDDDLQNPPEEIPKLLESIRSGFDVVYGTPEKQRHGLWRGLASSITKMALQGAMGAETARSVSAFRALRTQVREAFEDFRGPFPSIDVLLTWGTRRFTAIKVRHEPRQVGKSNYTFYKLIAHAMNMVTGFSTLPLQVTGVVGFVFAAFGFLVLAFVLIRYLQYGATVAGFPFLASIVSIFSGTQLFALGVIGEYLARIHFRMMERPAYVVRCHVGRKS